MWLSLLKLLLVLEKCAQRPSTDGADVTDGSLMVNAAEAPSGAIGVICAICG